MEPAATLNPAFKTASKFSIFSHETGSEDYVLKFDIAANARSILAALSTFEVGIINLDEAGSIASSSILPSARHSQRINDIFIDESLLYTCSNDHSCRIYDLNSNKLVKQLNRNDEIYSISKSKHILAGASESGIAFWDLRTMKFRNEFKETHGEEVTCVKFNPNIATQFVSSSLDGMLCLFDLTQPNEEEACQAIIRVDQPADRCGYINNEIVYGITTVDSVFIMNTSTETVLQNISTIEHTEFNKDYLIDAYGGSSDELKILVGRSKGYMEERAITKENDQIVQRVSKVFSSQSTKQIRQVKLLANDVYLLCSEDGSIEILTPTTEDITAALKRDVLHDGQTFESGIEEEAFEIFTPSAPEQKATKKKTMGFRPF